MNAIQESWVWRLIKSFGPWLLFGAVVGGISGLVAATTGLRLNLGLSSFVNSYAAGSLPIVASIVALVYIVGGIVTAVATIFPHRFYRWVALHDADDLIDQIPLYVWQAVASLLLGLALGVVLMADPFGLLRPQIAFVLFAIFSAIATYAYIRSWRLMDELMRALSTETVSISYFLVVLFGGGWTVLGHLELAEGPAFIDWITILWSMSLIATVWTTGQRGLLDEDA